MGKQPTHIQPRIVGFTRTPMNTAVLGAIEDAIMAECVYWNVSRSFVIATALAHVFGIDSQPDYRGDKPRKRRRRRRRRRAKRR